MMDDWFKNDPIVPPAAPQQAGSAEWWKADPMAEAAPAKAAAPAREPMADIGGPLDTGLNVPEKPATIAAQQSQLVAGRKPAVMFPQGTAEGELPEDTARVVTPRGVFHYDPSKFTAAKIRELSAAGRENEILGLGPVSKPEAEKAIKAGAPAVAVTERQPDGTEVKSAVGTPATAKAQKSAMEKTKTPGDTVQVETPESVVSGRLPETSPMPPIRPEGIGLPAEGPDAPARPHDVGAPMQGLDFDPNEPFRTGGALGDKIAGTQGGMLNTNEAVAKRKEAVAAATAAADSARAAATEARAEVERVRTRMMPPDDADEATLRESAALRTAARQMRQNPVVNAEKNAKALEKAADAAEDEARKAFQAPLATQNFLRNSDERFFSAAGNLATDAAETVARLGAVGADFQARKLAAATGAKPEDVERSIKEAAQGRKEAFQTARQTLAANAAPDPARAEEMGSKIVDGVASSAVFMATGMAGAALRLSPMAVTAIAGALPGAQQGWAQAEKQADLYPGSFPEWKKWAMFAAGAGAGGTEAIPIGHLFERLEKASGGGLTRYFGIVAANAGEEGLQEAFQALLNNAAEKGILDPNVALTKDVADNALVGGVTGALMAGGMASPKLIADLGASIVKRQVPEVGPPEPLSRDLQHGAPLEPENPTRAPAIPPASLGQNPGVQKTTGELIVRPAPLTPAEAPSVDDKPVDGSAAAATPAPNATAPEALDEGADAATAPVAADTPENRTLKAAGFSDEDIADMGPTQRAAELASASEEGVTDPGPQATIEPTIEGTIEPTIVPTGEPTNSEQTASNAGTRVAPVVAVTSADLDPARDQVNTDPSPAQIEAGNYQKGHARVEGFDVTIENPKGSTRRGTDADGKAWETTLPADYGYIKRSTGRDGDHVDVYLGDKGETGKAYVVEQIDPKTGKLDELKIVMGVGSQDEAAKLYEAAFSDGSGAARASAIVPMSTADLKEWLAKGGGKGRVPKRYRGEAQASNQGAKIDTPAKPAAGSAPNTAESAPSQAETPTAATAKGWRPIGKNADGHPVYEDERGVRSFVESGVRVTEAVGFVPGGGVVKKSDAERGSNYKPVADSAPENVRSTVTDGKVDSSGNLPVIDDRERQRLENVRKLEAIEAEAAKDKAKTPEPRADAPKTTSARKAAIRARLVEAGLPDADIDEEAVAWAAALMANGTPLEDAYAQASIEILEAAGGDEDTSASGEPAAGDQAGDERGADGARSDAPGAVLETEKGPDGGVRPAPDQGDRGQGEAAVGDRSKRVRALFNSRAFRKAVAEWRTANSGKTFDYPHPESEVAYAMLDGYEAAKAGRAPDPEHRHNQPFTPEHETGFNPGNGYRTGYVFGEKGVIEQERAGDNAAWLASFDKPAAPTTEKVSDEFATALAETRFSDKPAAKGPDGRGWRIKREGAGYIVMRMANERGKPPTYFRPEGSALWSFPKAVDEAQSRAATFPTAEPATEKGGSRTADIQAEDSDETVSATLTRDGPWDFNDTWPDVDRAKIEALAVEGRDPFGSHGKAPTVEQIVFTLDESMGEISAAVAQGKTGRKIIADLDAGRFEGYREAKTAKGRQALRERTLASIEAAQREVMGSAEAVADLFGRKAAASLVREARRRVAQNDGPVSATTMANATKPAPADDFDAQFEAGFAEGLTDESAAKPAEPAPAAAPAKAPRTKRTKTELAVSAGTNALESADAAMAGLVAMFADPSRLGSGPVFDEKTWAKAKPMFAKAAEKFGHMVDDVTALVAAMVREMRASHGLTNEIMERLKPYLRRFVQEVRSGVIRLKEATNGPRDTNLDQPGEREAGAGMADGERSGNGTAGELDSAPSADGEGIGSGPDSEAGPRAGGEDAENGTGEPESGDAADGRPGAGGTGVADDGAAGRPGRKPASTRPNYHIADPEQLIGGTPKVRFARNRTAITALQAIQDEGRDPTADELDAMAGYIGWGSFGQELFQGTWDKPRPKPEWAKEDTWLRQHLGQAEWQSAQNSIINAHYTDPPTVQAMWDMVRAMGFKGGRVLEPSMGVGNFFGLMPRDLMAASDLTGIELDGLTGGMAKLLYPGANIQIKGYEKSKTPDNFYDVVIGNWPFADVEVPDRRYNHLSPLLHDYFFAKALDQVRPGGLVIGITSAGTMDKQGKSIRIHLAKNAELVASFRLPSGAFAKYAGTSVVTDIVILKKRATPIHSLMQMSEAEGKWIELAEVNTPAGTPIKVNAYYTANPKHVLGTLNFGSGSTYGRPSMIVDRPADLESRLNALPATLPADGFAPVKRGKEARFITNNVKDREGSIVTAPKGEKPGFYVVQGERLAALEDLTKYKLKDAAKTAEREKQIGKLVELRKLYGVLIDAEREGAHNTEDHRKALKTAYNAFRKAHGTIGGSDGLAILKRVRDPFASSLEALERPDGSPSEILSRATVRAVKKLDNPTVRDAFVMARNESLHVDLALVAALAKTTEDKVAAELLDSKAIYRTPGGGYEVSDVFLSGNVRRKLREAVEAQEAGEDMAAAIEALKTVLPKDVPYFQIEAQAGATWVGNDDYREFIREMLGVPTVEGIEVRYNAGSWKVRFTNRSHNRRPEAQATWGTGRYPFDKLVSSALNNQTIKIYDQTSDGPVFNEDESKLANDKVTRLREHFSAWAWADAERRVRFEKDYNETMNAIATASFDGSFLEFPGMALRRGKDAFSLRQHQVDAIWRGVANGRGLYAHEVGTGKTYTMGGVAVESRRYGVARKPMILAHNANSASVAREIQEMYPGAKVLYIDNLSPDNIEATLRRVANDEWDAVVMPHSVADRLSLREETLMELAREEIAALEEEAYAAADEDGVDIRNVDFNDEDEVKKIRSVTAKNLVKQRQRIIAKIQKMAQRSSRENAIAFEDLGIDMIIVDEAHEFKKPPIVTKMQLKGLNVSTSDRSISLKFLTDYVKKLNGGKGIHVFTGTPITNTLTEIYNMMRFVMEDQMKRDGIDGWDAWFNTFAAASSDVELTPTGDYEPVTRLSAFVNVAELRRMSGQFMDIVFADDMPEFKPRPTSTGKTMADELTDAERAELTEGRSESPQGRPYKKVITDVGPMGPQQLEVLEELAERARSFKAMTKKDRRLAMLSGDKRSPIIVEGAAAAAGLDVRLFDMGAEDDSNSKVNRVARNVLTHYAEHPLTTQVVFVDQGYNDFSDRSETRGDEKVKVRVPRFNLVADLVAKLVKKGIPQAQIAIVNGNVKAEKRKEIADKMNTGEIRVVIGLSSTLGVGVNMQANLRAMHHMDAPWMPGLLEQRNGRGHRQGNKWNTVLEYRYITEKLDGRRWQVLAVKDRFIKAFLKADESVRVIEGDAVDDSESADDISKTLAEAAGDPRLLLINKFKADVNRLENRERLHSFGIFDAKDRAKKTRIAIEYTEQNIGKYQEDLSAWSAARGEDGKTLSVVVNKKTYTDRKEAQAAIDDFVTKSGDVVKGTSGGAKRLAVEVNGVRLMYRWPAVYDEPTYMARSASGLEYALGQASVASIESVIRNLPKRIEDGKAEVTDQKASIVRMEDAANQPFQQANALVAKRQMLADLERDLQANPVPAPGWLRHGAPLDTLIYVDGQERVVEGHRWTDADYELVTAQGPVSYLEAKDALGAPIFDAHPHSPPVTKKAEASAAVPPRAQASELAMTPRAKASGLDAQHVAEIVEEIVNRVLGERRVNLSIPGALSVRGTLVSGVWDAANRLLAVSMESRNKSNTAHHEAFHALQTLGVFNDAEIAILARETARLRGSIIRFYGGALTEADLPIGETSAYAYGYYAAARDRGVHVSDLHIGVRRLFDRIYQIIARLRNWAQGLGFQNAEDIFERVRTGDKRDQQEDAYFSWDNNPDLRAQLWAEASGDPAQRQQRLAQSGDRDRTSKVIAYAADMFVRLKELQEKFGRDLPGSTFADAYRAIGAINTRISERVEDMTHDELDPMLDLIEPLKVDDATRNAVGVPLPDGEAIVHRFMYVRHAPERNAAIQAINPKFQLDGGSGILTADAQAEYAAFLADPNIADIQAAADAVTAMNERDLVERERAGLMSAKQVQAISQAYQFYVPLRGFEGDEYMDEGAQSGTGFSVAAREVPTMMGRSSLADSVVAQTVNKRITGIQRAQKNRVDLMLFRLAQQMTGHYGKDQTPLLARTKLPMKDVLGRGTGTVVNVVDQEYRLRPDVLVAKIDGKPRYIEVRREPQLADALKNNLVAMDDAPIRAWGTATRFLGHMWTVYNPVFPLINFGRDLLDASTAANALLGDGGLKVYLARLMPGLGQSIRYMAGRETADFRQFRQDGGKMSFAKLRSMEEIERVIDRKVNGENPVMKAARLVPAVLQHWGDIFENAHRFALYEAALRQGLSRADAARAALEGTMNFHRKGYGRGVALFKMVFPFMNPSIQAPLRGARLIKEAGGMETATGRAMAGKLLAKGLAKSFGAAIPIGFAIAMLNYALGGDDDDKVPFWDKAQADPRNANNIMVYVGGKDAQGRRNVAMIPAFPEVMLPIKMGYALASAIMGTRSVGNVFKDLGMALYALSPTHGRGVTPSLLAPLVDIYTNLNSFGSPIHPRENANTKGVPSPERKYADTPKAWQDLARALHTATFGGVNLHPEDVRHLARQLSGGWYDVTAQIGSALGVTPQEERLPVGLRRYLATGDKVHVAYDRKAFTAAEEKANAGRAAIKAKVDDPTIVDARAQRANRGAKREEIEAAGGSLGRQGGVNTPASDIADTGRQVLAGIYKRRDALMAGNADPAEKTRLRAALESEISTTRKRYGQMLKGVEAGTVKYEDIRGQLARERALSRRGRDPQAP